MPPSEPTPPDQGALEQLSKASFAAVDFETATGSRASACALGISLVDDGQITSGRMWLIRPPGNEYDPYNTMIHGIGPQDTVSAPELPDVWAEAQAVIGKRPVVAHNAAFDIGVLREGLSLFERDWPSLDVFCTLVLSRRVWPGLISYSLLPVCGFLGIDLAHHHDPAEDATACAEIGRRLCAATRADNLTSVAEQAEVRVGSLTRDTWESCVHKYKQFTAFSKLAPTTVTFDPEHPFYGRSVAFTGTLLSMTRKEAAQRVVDAGGRYSSSVSPQTDYLVSAEQDFSRFVDGKMSRKTRTVRELLAAGHSIEIISEHDFLTMVGAPAVEA